MLCLAIGPRHSQHAQKLKAFLTMPAAGLNTTAFLCSDGTIHHVGRASPCIRELYYRAGVMEYTGMAAQLDELVLLTPDGKALAIARREPDAIPVQEDAEKYTWHADWFNGIPAKAPGTTFVSCSAGHSHVILLRSDGYATGYGDNSHGQLDIPPLPLGITYVSASAGGDQTVLLRSNGTVVRIGRDFIDHLRRSQHAGPCRIPTLPTGLTWIKASAGTNSLFCLLRNDGQLFLLDRHSRSEVLVEEVAAGKGIKQLVVGWDHAVVLFDDGTAKGWDLCYTRRPGPRACPPGAQHPWVRWNDTLPADIPALEDGVTYVEVSAGDHHTALLRSDCRAVSVGTNSSGQCNPVSAPTDQFFVPVNTPRPSKVLQLLVKNNSADTMTIELLNVLNGEVQCILKVDGVDAMAEPIHSTVRERAVHILGIAKVKLLLPGGGLVPPTMVWGELW